MPDAPVPAGAASDEPIPRDPQHLTADEVIELLELQAHPEGGWYAETWRDASAAGERGHGTAIYFLLAAGERSHWHRVDAHEIWHHYAGAPLVLATAPDDDTAPADQVLGTDLAAGQRPQLHVPQGWWQAAWSLGEWTLVGATVSPGFMFEGFELAADDWSPGG